MIKTVLIADDEVDVCRLVKLNLEKTGEFSVLTATDGNTGIGLARREKPVSTEELIHCINTVLGLKQAGSELKLSD